MTYTQVVEIKSDNPNAVEQVINNLSKEVSNAERYGVSVTVRRVDVSDKEVSGFNNE